MELPTQQLNQALVLREQLPLARPYMTPRTPTEERLAKIWRQVLSMDVVGVEDDYNDLGGDSMLAVAIFRMIEKSYLITMPLKLLVDSPTIAKLAVQVDALVHGRAAGK